MDRRTFNVGCGSAFLLFGWPAIAQDRRPAIGFLSNFAPADSKWSLDAFRAGLAELGYIDGRTITIEVRYTEGQVERLPSLARELVAARPDVIVASGPQAARALKDATKTLPIVLAVITDPVDDGLVISLAHPGGNITGLAFQNRELTGKRLELLQAVVPSARQIAVLSDTTMGNTASASEALAAASLLGLTARVYSVQRAGDFDGAVRAMRRDKADGLIVLASPMLNANRKSLVQIIAQNSLPATYEVRAFVDDGGLMSYGPSFVEMYRRSAAYVDKILKGAKTQDLAMEQPAKFEFVVNARAAKALRLEIPSALLLRADEVIE